MSTQAISLKLQAIGASPGMAVGRAFVLDRRRVRTPKLQARPPRRSERELMRFKTAIDLSEHQLLELKNRLEQSDGKDHALILEAHRLMLRDPMLVDEVNKLIAADQINAEWAVRRVTRKIKHLFDEIPDEYFRERRADVDFIADRVVRNLLGQVVDVEEEVPEGAVDRRPRPVAGGRGDARPHRAGGGLRHRRGRLHQPHRHRRPRPRAPRRWSGAGPGLGADLPGRHRRRGRRRAGCSG